LTESSRRIAEELVVLVKATEAGVTFYQFENLMACPGIVHRIFSRNGGCSRPPYASLNVALSVGDKKKSVDRNRELIRRRIDADALIFVSQVHGQQIAILRNEDGAAGENPLGEAVTADAMVTDRPRWYPAIQVADCQAVLLYEPVHRVIANIHCGWRGSILNIIGRTVDAMIVSFKCEPGHMWAGIGPSLGPCCAEFVNYKTEIPEALWRYKVSNHHFDFWSISSAQLVKAGVPAQNIENGRICTRCRSDEFFSYRAGKITGRFAAVIGLI
jgi:YfiH family protein